MNGNIYQQLGLKRVINACGKMTILGVSAVDPQVMQATAQAAGAFVEIDKLTDRAGELVSAHTGAEDSYITSCASAGIAIAVAAAITMAISYGLVHKGYTLGRDSIIGLLQGGRIKELIYGANVLGLIMMGALSASYVKITTPLKISALKGSEVVVQQILDSIAPGLLPLAAKGMKMAISNGITAAQIIESPIPASGPIRPVLIPVIEASLIGSPRVFCSSMAMEIPWITEPKVCSELKKFRWRLSASACSSFPGYSFLMMGVIEAQKIRLCRRS